MSCAVGLSEAPLTVAKCLLVLFVGFPCVLGPESPAAAAVTAMTCDESSKQAVQSRVEGGGGFDFGSCFYQRSPNTLTLENLRSADGFDP